LDYFEESPEKISFVFDSMTDNQLEIVFLNRLPEPIHLQNGEKKTSIFYFGIAQDMEQLNPYFNCEAYNGNLPLRKPRRNWKKKATVILMQFWTEQNIFTD